MTSYIEERIDETYNEGYDEGWNKALNENNKAWFKRLKKARKENAHIQKQMIDEWFEELREELNLSEE